MNVENVVFQQDNLTSAFSLMAHFRRQKKLCDIVLKVDGQTFHAHKLVLASTIPYFHAMFTNDMMESRNKEIEMKCLDATALEALVNFAYSGRIVLDGDNVQSIFIGASYLLLNNMRDACANYMFKGICPQNAVGLWRFATSYDCSTLADPAEKYIEFHFNEVSQHEEYLNLSLSEVTNLLSKSELQVKSEEPVFEACMRWTKHDVEERNEHLLELLSLVRFPLLSPEYIKDKVLNEDQIRSSTQCRDLVDKALTFHAVPESRALLQSFCTEPRGSITGYMYAIGRNRIDILENSPIEYYDPKINKWQMALPVFEGLQDSGVVVLKNKLYFIGGLLDFKALSRVDVYDTVTKEWSVGRPMIRERRQLGATVLDDKIYVCGGEDDVTHLNALERFDPDTNSWCTLAPMNKRRTQGALVACRGYLYAIGGRASGVIHDSVERYDPATNSWEDVAPMLTKRYRLGAATLNDKLYACGGDNGKCSIRTVEMYDPWMNKWTSVAPMNMARLQVAASANMGKVWAVGGLNTDAIVTMEVYDPKQCTWTYAADMMAVRGGVNLAVVPFPEEG